MAKFDLPYCVYTTELYVHSAVAPPPAYPAIAEE